MTITTTEVWTNVDEARATLLGLIEADVDRVEPPQLTHTTADIQRRQIRHLNSVLDRIEGFVDRFALGLCTAVIVVFAPVAAAVTNPINVLVAGAISLISIGTLWMGVSIYLRKL